MQRDPGLQPQRTALAWVRTGLAVFVNALIVLRAGFATAQVFILALGTILLAASALSVVLGTWRVRHLAADGARAGPKDDGREGKDGRDGVDRVARVLRRRPVDGGHDRIAEGIHCFP